MSNIIIMIACIAIGVYTGFITGYCIGFEKNTGK